MISDHDLFVGGWGFGLSSVVRPLSFLDFEITSFLHPQRNARSIPRRDPTSYPTGPSSHRPFTITKIERAGDNEVAEWIWSTTEWLLRFLAVSCNYIGRNCSPPKMNSQGKTHVTNHARLRKEHVNECQNSTGFLVLLSVLWWHGTLPRAPN
jgi:hypothetical protein